MTDSPMRELLAEGGKATYRPLPSLKDAQQDPNGVAVFEGDDGGEIYIVCPARLIRCGEDVLLSLLEDIDEIEWQGNDANMRRIYYETQMQGAQVPGGMGGGIVTAEPWINPRLIQKGLGESIRAVLSGRKRKLN